MDKDVLSQVRKLKALPGIGEYKIGFTGSYARGTETEESGIDIVIDINMLSLEQLELIRSKFNREIDIIQLKLLAEEDKELDEFTLEEGLPLNENSAYKSICREVIWID